MTATSATAGWLKMTSSTSIDETFSAPVMITSLRAAELRGALDSRQGVVGVQQLQQPGGVLAHDGDALTRARTPSASRPACQARTRRASSP
jgi:hypothetical protein